MVLASPSRCRYLITGGAGFIGSHLADALLRRGHAIRVLDDFSTGKRSNLDPRCEVIAGDVADAVTMREAFTDVAGCFHLAAVASVARSNEDWVGTHRTNAAGTVAVLDTARAAGGVPVVYASSAAVYGDQGGGAIQETAALRPRTAYGADKLASELHARVAFEVHQVPTLGFRFFNVYGPRQDPSSPYSGVISLFAARITEGQVLSIHGDGGQTRDFVFVADVVEHLQRGMTLLRAAPQATVLNVCTGYATSICDLAKLLGDISGHPARIEFTSARPGDIRTSLGSPAAARSMLGCRAEVELKDGLAATLGLPQRDGKGPLSAA